MRAWIEIDDVGSQFLSRAGEGSVISVSPVGLVGPDEVYSFYLVQIDCDQAMTAVRVRVRAQVATEDPLFAIASAAFEEDRAMVWAIQWHRHEWVPAGIPITSLDLATDAVGRLVELRRADSETGVPEHVPASWGRLGS